MKRTKEWWARLTREERAELVWIEHGANHPTGLGGYLPDDCSECGACGRAMLGSGLCSYCSSRLDELLNKADAIAKEMEAE